MYDPKHMNKIEVATTTLKNAAAAILDRSKKHGDTLKSFAMMGQLWQTYLAHAYQANGNHTIRPHDVAQMMIMLKIARSLYGQSSDNYVDQAGFAALAAMLDPMDVMEKELSDVSIPNVPTKSPTTAL